MKIVGYLISIIGLVILGAGSFKPVKDFVNGIVKIPASITDIYFMVGGLVILILGLWIVTKSGRKSSAKQPAEVPIYRGEKVVGFRRMGK